MKRRAVYLGDVPSVFDRLSNADGISVAGWLFEKGDEPERILKSAQKQGIPCTRVSTAEEARSALASMGPVDLGVICNFGIILSGKSISLARNGFVNLHLGLLPENPGRSPVWRVIERGEALTGVSLHRVTEKADEGPMIDRAVLSTGGSSDALELFERLTEQAGLLLLKHLPALMEERRGL